jgi:anti-anti-sigma factor
MPVMRRVGSTCAAVGMAAFASQPSESRTARFTADYERSAAVVSARGELDAVNAGQFADYAQNCAASSKRLIVDLNGVEFFGTAGFSALHTINVRCAEAGVPWAVVPSRAVSRLLRICDPDRALPVTESVAAALAADEQPRGLLQLVSQSR